MNELEMVQSLDPEMRKALFHRISLGTDAWSLRWTQYLWSSDFGPVGSETPDDLSDLGELSIMLLPDLSDDCVVENRVTTYEKRIS